MERTHSDDFARPWWEHAVIYQVYPRSFFDSDGDGIGDLKGIELRLDYLAETLGVDALWISPFFPSPMRDFGYDVSNHVGVDPIFGSLSDAEDLIRAIHARDMKAILDYVPNHTSSDHPWFVESRQSRDSAKRDWYIWRDPATAGSRPNNWLSVFGGPAWTLDPATGQYYLHSFLESQPDLNWRNPEVVEAMHDVLRFWIDRGVDGFRVDAAHFVGKDLQLRNNPAARPGERFMHKALGEYDSQSHVYDKGTPFAHEVYRGIRVLIDEYPADRDVLLIAEMHLYDWEEWASYFGPNLDEFHLPYNFGLLDVEWKAAEVRNLVSSIEQALPGGAWPSWVTGNHDEPRVASRLGSDCARSAMVLLLTLRGTPTIYYGDELGAVDTSVPPELRQDPWGLRAPDLDVGRDPQRAPMPWTLEPHGGFTTGTARPWLPTIDPAEYCVEAQLRRPGSMLELTRALLRLRRGRSSLQTGEYRPLESGCADVLGFARVLPDESTAVFVSFTGGTLEFELPAGPSFGLLFSTEAGECAEQEGGTNHVRLNGFESVIFDMRFPE